MTAKARRHLPVMRSTTPGRGWRGARRVSLALAWVALLIAPLLGGWQRLDRNYLSAWDEHGWDLPAWILSLLPRGEAPAAAYEANDLMGGGAAVDYLGVPAMDPTMGLLALMHSHLSWTVMLAFLVPVGLGLLAGRAFCGWLCPFGSLARGMAWLLSRVTIGPRRVVLPRSRRVRYVVLAGALGAGMIGVPGVLSLLLPHALLQQSAYSMWLMGGGSAIVGWLGGLLLAGVLLGPTAYCSLLCPTGTALSLLGRARLAHVTLAEPARCGKHCRLCSSACWLGLDPASGDPGPDCDSCASCFAACPRDNLRVGLSTPRRRSAATMALLATAALLVPSSARARDDGNPAFARPTLLLESRRVVGDVQIDVSVAYVPAVDIDVDAPPPAETRISVALVRRTPRHTDEHGRIDLRPFYAGPITLRVAPTHEEKVELSALHPLEPRSTPRRSIYRFVSPIALGPGDSMTLEPIEGWVDRAQTWTIRSAHAGGGVRSGWMALLSATLLFSGAIAAAIGVEGSLQRTRRRARNVRN